MPPDLALLATLTSSNYPCLEHVFMVSNVFAAIDVRLYFVFLTGVIFLLFYRHKLTDKHNFVDILYHVILGIYNCHLIDTEKLIVDGVTDLYASAYTLSV